MSNHGTCPIAIEASGFQAPHTYFNGVWQDTGVESNAREVYRHTLDTSKYMWYNTGGWNVGNLATVDCSMPSDETCPIGSWTCGGLTVIWPCYWHNPRGASWASAKGLNDTTSCCSSVSSTSAGWVSVVNDTSFPCTTCIDDTFAGCEDNWGDCTQTDQNAANYIGNYGVAAGAGGTDHGGVCKWMNSSTSSYDYGTSSDGCTFWYYNQRGNYADEADWLANDPTQQYTQVHLNDYACWNGMLYSFSNQVSDGDTLSGTYTFVNNIFDYMTPEDGCEGCCACDGWSRMEYPNFPYMPWAAYTCCTGSLQPLQAMADSSKTCCQNGTELWIWAGGNTLALANAEVDKLALNILHRGFIYTGLSSSGDYTPSCSWQGSSSSSGGGSSPLISDGAEWESLLAVPPSSSNPDQDYAFTFLPLHHRTSRPGAPTIQGGRQLCTSCGTQRGTVRPNRFGPWCGRMIAAGGYPRVRIVGRQICPTRTTVYPPPTRPTTPIPKEWCHKVWRQFCLNDSANSSCSVSANPPPSYPCVSSPQSITWPTNLPLDACKAWQGEGKVTCETGIAGIALQFTPPGFTAQYVYGPWGQNEIRFRFQWLLPLYGKFNPILYVQDKCSKTIAHHFPFDVNCSSWSLTSSLAGQSVHPSACICSWSSMNFMPFLPPSSSSQGGGGTNNSSSSGGGGGGGGAAASGKEYYFAEYSCEDINTQAPDLICDPAKRPFMNPPLRHVVIPRNYMPKNGGNVCVSNPLTFHFVIKTNPSQCHLYVNEPNPCLLNLSSLDFRNMGALDNCCQCSDKPKCSPYSRSLPEDTVYLANGTGGLHTYSVDSSGHLTHNSRDTQQYIGQDDAGTNVSVLPDAMDVWGHGNFIYLSYSNGGVHTYTNDGGNLTHIDFDRQHGIYGRVNGVWRVGHLLVVAESGPDQKEHVHTYAVDPDGNLTHIHSHYLCGQPKQVWGDDHFIYVAMGTCGLHVYLLHQTGLLSYQSCLGCYVGQPNNFSCDDVWGDGDFIYAATTLGLMTFSINAVGNLTIIDSHKPTSHMGHGVWGDGDFIYYTDGIGGLHTYSVDAAGNLTHIDSDVQGVGHHALKVWGDGNFIYLANGEGGLHTYSVNTSGILQHIDSDVQSTGCSGTCYAAGVWAKAAGTPPSSPPEPKPSITLRPGKYCFHQEFYAWPVLSAPTKDNRETINPSTTCEPADNCGATYKHPYPEPEIISIRVPKIFSEIESKNKWIALDPKHPDEAHQYYKIDKPAGPPIYCAVPPASLLNAADPYNTYNSLKIVSNSSLNGNTDFTDLSNHNHTVNAVAVQHTTGRYKWPPSSILFTNFENYLNVPAHDSLRFGTGDFTIECWFFVNQFRNTGPFALDPDRPLAFSDPLQTREEYWSGLITNMKARTDDDKSYYGWQIAYDQFGQLAWRSTDGSNIASFSLPDGTVSRGQWHHVLVARSGTSTHLYLNGVLRASITDTLNYNHLHPINIGELYSGGGMTNFEEHLGYYHNGWMEDIRITKGFARCTGGHS